MVIIFVCPPLEFDLLAIVYTLQKFCCFAITRDYFLFQILLHLMRSYFPVSLRQVTLSGNNISRNTIEKIEAYLETDDKDSSDGETIIKVIKDPCCEFDKCNSGSGGRRLTVTDGKTITSVDLCGPEKRSKRGCKRK